ncbi:ADP-ribosylglycohydrolase family protein [Intestinibacter bartlettii]|uniref:ADP-ribosylglycohydrolase family protein n=1 Tax=Intestinibacter bartlettii TaxID=261299 RepID=A0ABS6DX81_9FIRM|nr:ADP-ribosylglycohydrolase family protein [Intestinibacter bartlettii]MBU5336018.1 ADP-ribosylglycohydrolase family protein [Intestinibacter bartlettii]
MNKVSYPRNKVLGGIWGLIIGDAVGVPYEFTPQEYIPNIDKIDMVAPKYFRKTYIDVPFGTYSDDSAQFLCLIDSYIECDGFEINNAAKKLLLWLSNGLWAVDGEVFDVGRQTLKALTEYARGTSPRYSGLCEPEGKGNGALMRTLALALLEDESDEKLVIDSHEQAMITHGNICNHVCCAFYNLIAKYMLEGIEFEEAYSTAVDSLRRIYKDKKVYLEEFENNILPDGIIEERGTGYVIDCLKSTFKIIRESSSYEEAIKKAIALGNDTDTTAAVVGGLAGIIYGFDKIPSRWYDQIRGKEKVLELIDRINFENI